MKMNKNEIMELCSREKTVCGTGFFSEKAFVKKFDLVGPRIQYHRCLCLLVGAKECLTYQTIPPKPGQEKCIAYPAIPRFGLDHTGYYSRSGNPDKISVCVFFPYGLREHHTQQLDQFVEDNALAVAYFDRGTGWYGATNMVVVWAPKDF